MRAQCCSEWMIAGLTAMTIAACGGRSTQESMPTTTDSTAMTETAPEAAPAADEDCVIDVDLTGGVVRAMDIEGGVALVFEATTIDAAEMRNRVHLLADNQRGAGSAAGQGGATGAGVGNSDVDGTTALDLDKSRSTGEGDPKTPDVETPPPPGSDTTGDTAGGTTGQATYAVRETLSGVPAIATVVDTTSGAQLELRAQDPADINALRTNARRHVDQITGGECRISVSRL